jgi:hypothetical protein
MHNYDFKCLSSFEFERLTRDLLQAHWGIHLESFRAGKDKGIDLRYSAGPNSTIIQCKHFSETGFAGLARTLSQKELPKIKRLSPARYAIATSISLTVHQKTELLNTLHPYCRTTGDIFDANDLNNLLAKHPNIETTHFKLWLCSTRVLDRILHSSVFNTTELTLENIRNKLRLYVPNKSYERALEILQNNHYCIVSGIPGIGKTTLAEVLLAAYLDKGYEAIAVSSNIAEAFSLFKSTKRQIFYYDDFLGRTALSDKLGKNEDARILQLIQVVAKSKGHLLLLTTREYILNQAKQTYGRLDAHDIDLAKVTLDLGNYTIKHRAGILLNHLHFSQVASETIATFVASGHHRKVIRHRNFSPRIVEWMTSSVGARVAPLDFGDTFVHNLDNPSRLWDHALKNEISSDARTIALVLMSLGGRSGLSELQVASFGALHSQDEIGFERALKELDGTFVSTKRPDSVTCIVSIHNPSVEDVLKTFLCSNALTWVALVSAAQYFSQIQGLISVLDGLSPDAARGRLIRAGELVRDRARQLFQTQSTAVVIAKSPTGATVVCPDPGDSPEDRLAFLLEVGAKYNIPLIHEASQAVAPGVADRILVSPHPDAFERLLAQLRTTSLGESRNSLLAAMQKALTVDLNQARDFERFCDIDQAYPDLIGQARRAQVTAQFANFLDYNFPDDIESWDDYDTMRADWEVVQEVAIHFNCDLSGISAAIEEKLAELMGPDFDDDDWREHREGYESEEISDADVDDMFDSLVE